MYLEAYEGVMMPGRRVYDKMTDVTTDEYIDVQYAKKIEFHVLYGTFHQPPSLDTYGFHVIKISP